MAIGNLMQEETAPAEDDQTAILSKLVQELQMQNAVLRMDLERLRSGMQRIIDNLNAPKGTPMSRY